MLKVRYFVILSDLIGTTFFHYITKKNKNNHETRLSETNANQRGVKERTFVKSIFETCLLIFEYRVFL